MDIETGKNSKFFYFGIIYVLYTYVYKENNFINFLIIFLAQKYISKIKTTNENYINPRKNIEHLHLLHTNPYIIVYTQLFYLCISNKCVI